MITNSTPQRQLRGHMPQRTTPRAATTGEHHARLAHRLTTRDRWITRMLHEHRVLTTHQIAATAFTTLRAANKRLLDLYRWRVIDRFQPFVHTGTAPMHYVLDTAGAAVLAHEDGLEPSKTGYRHETAIGIAHSLRLAHTVGRNDFFVSLIAMSRHTREHHQLIAWWSEARCARHFGDITRPDAYGRWREDGREVEFFLEYDCGTEPLHQLATKLRGYHRLAVATGVVTPLLFWLPSTAREAGARRVLATARAELDNPSLVPVATTAATLTASDGRDSPAAARWLTVSGQDQPARLQLAELWPKSVSTHNTGTVTPHLSVPTAGRTELTPPAPMPPP
ncbi:hypothetical protein KALB_5173 [Kutzneria albida DSM 43870]|uniref:Replication-relaxation n=2 Tax=Kutzneria TaxID=43356 RepID=W5WCP9_9PSEU|nr:replication-relaxation family protein [Kutzneria albida]AHH98535.1 hypothetical protein KALB_5173 [Kutzneria albida DSM 43870]